jgi:hypothetical protein
MAASVNNYYIGKGIVSFRKTGGAWVDMGNAPEFEFTPKADTLDHFSSREGIKSLDKSVVLSRSAEVRLVLEEFTMENLALALLGTVAGSQLDIFSTDAVEGALAFVGTNDVGKKFEMLLKSVTFLPSSTLKLIGEDWGQIELTGKCATKDGSFGSMTDLDTASTGAVSSGP